MFFVHFIYMTRYTEAWVGKIRKHVILQGDIYDIAKYDD